MKKYLLGIDIGTSACKITVFDRDGNVVANASGEYSVYYPNAGWAEQTPEEWWSAVCSTLKEIFAAGYVLPNEIAGIGIDGQSWSSIMVDKDGNVLANTPIWMDTRAKTICDNLNRQIGSREIFELSGNPLQPSYSTAKIIWYKQNYPSLYNNIYKVLQSNSYIAYKLTGNITQDLSQGYGLHCFNMHTGNWDRDMCKELGISYDMLPDIYNCDEIVGTVTKKASVETGLKEGIPVVAGGLDAACGALGAGVIYSGETQEQGGQAGGMSICTDTYKSDARLILSYHVIPGKWLLQGGTTGGGGTMRWLEREFADYERSEGKKLGKSSLEIFNELAEKVEPGCNGLVFLPYMSGERSPIWNPDAKGVFYGLDFSKTKGHIIRSVMEGVAFSLRHNLQVAQEAGVKVDVLKAMGGSANSLLWTQIKSDITGKPITVPSSDTATTLGAALLAGVGTGIYKNYDEAVKCTVKNKRYHTPNVSCQEIYNQNFEIYLKVYKNLEDIMRGE